MASHTLTHALISNSGAVKRDGGDPALENYVVKLDDAGEIDPTFLPAAAISAKREYLAFAREGATTDMYLKVGEVYSNLAGARLVRAAELIGISAQNSAVNTFTIRVRKNGGLANLASLAVVAADGDEDSTVSVVFAAGDELQVYCEGTADDPVVLLQLEET